MLPERMQYKHPTQRRADNRSRISGFERAVLTIDPRFEFCHKKSQILIGLSANGLIGDLIDYRGVLIKPILGIVDSHQNQRKIRRTTCQGSRRFIGLPFHTKSGPLPIE